MSKISVVFWTQGGNTESMANAVVEGIKEAGKEAEAVFVSDMNIDELKGEGVFALGCPAMEPKYSKRVRWSRLLQTWKDLLPERRLDCLVLTDGVTASGCVTGKHV